MNILIPDSWLRDYLKTKATPKQIAEYLSLCGPSVERMNEINGDIIYDIEVTTNRVDCMSVIGIAREAVVILPEFGIEATFKLPKTLKLLTTTKPTDITIENNPSLCRRILAVKLENVTVKPSPKWLADRLIKVGQRPLNNLIDITNYVMWEIGHPIHVFDYDRLTNKTILVREAKKSEKFITLDNKTHITNGGEIIFDNGKGEIIDLPGIMGTANTVVSDRTKNILLFIENSDPVKIRLAAMGLSIRTQAAVINEKDPDPESAYTAIMQALSLYKELASPKSISKLTDIYEQKPAIHQVEVSREQLQTYLGTEIEPKRFKSILTRLGCTVSGFTVAPPTWRSHDIQIPQDLIEEVARIYGYHNIKTKLPDTEPPVIYEKPILSWEQKIKHKLADWGYTETYTYSMISEELMGLFDLDKTKVYKIANPLSSEWIYMRPSLLPSILMTVKQNLANTNNLSLFELSMVYEYKNNDLPHEVSTLIIVKTGEQYPALKGLSENLFQMFGIPYPDITPSTNPHYHPSRSASLGDYGVIGEINPDLLKTMGINERITVLTLNIEKIVNQANTKKTFQAIPKYPASFEDLTFISPEKTAVGPVLTALNSIDPIIEKVELIDSFNNSKTFHITYRSKTKNLEAENLKILREKIIAAAEKHFHATLKTI